MITGYGIEGSLIYAYSAPLRDLITHTGEANIEIDLLPDVSLARVQERLSLTHGKQTFSHHLKSSVGIAGVKAALLYEVMPDAANRDPSVLAQTLKAIPLCLRATRPLDEAISSAGGVKFSALDQNLMLTQMPGVFCAGEMLDWEAPTGGYLLTACLSSGHFVGQRVLQYLRQQNT